MSPKPAKNHVEEAVRAATKLLAGLDRRITVQLQRAARGGIARADGYPTSTLGAGGSSGGAGIRVDADEHGEAERIPATSTEIAALTETPDDEQRRLALKAWHELEAIVKQLGLIDGWLARCEAAGTPTANDEDAWCENHARHGIAEPRDHANRRKDCAWCYGILRTYGALPNRTLIERRARGERFSEQAITAALGATRKAG